VFFTIGIQIAAVIEEILQAGLDVDAEVGRKVVLQAKARKGSMEYGCFYGLLMQGKHLT
jgi:hypothetical protein